MLKNLLAQIKVRIRHWQGNNGQIQEHEPMLSNVFRLTLRLTLTPGPSWNQWRNPRLRIIMKSFAFQLVSKVNGCLFFLTSFFNVLRIWCLSSHPDLKTMTERLKNRYYVTKKLFIADLQRIITNCREYNPPDSEYCKCANTLEKFFYFKLKDGGLIDKWTQPESSSETTGDCPSQPHTNQEKSNTGCQAT